MPTSPDGRFFTGFTTFDPTTGLTNSIAIDTAEIQQTPQVLEAQPITTPSFENATRDSRHALFYAVNPADGSNALVEVSRATGAQRQVSTGNTAFAHYALHGSKLAFSDGSQGNPADLFSTTDIRTVDLSATTLAPRLIAPQAHPVFFPSHDRQAMIYTTDTGSPGLFIARLP